MSLLHIKKCYEGIFMIFVTGDTHGSLDITN